MNDLQLEKIESPPDLVDRVYRALVDAISTGVLKPGTRVTQEELAEQLAVSRQPVLQAIRLLKNDGLLQDAAGRGVVVTPLDVQLIAQVYQVRGALDALAARLAAQRKHRIDPQIIEHGRKAVGGTGPGRITAAIDADMAFHGAIYAAAGNPLIEQSARLHWCHVRRAMGAVLQISSLPEAVWAQHEDIAQAIAAGQAAKAERLMSHHVQHAVDTMGVRLAPAPARRTRARA